MTMIASQLHSAATALTTPLSCVKMRPTCSRTSSSSPAACHVHKQQSCIDTDAM